QADEVLAAHQPYHRAAVERLLGEPFPDELQDRVPQGAAAHPELAGDRRHRQPGPRRQRAGEDAVAQEPVHPLPHALVAVEEQGFAGLLGHAGGLPVAVRDPERRDASRKTSTKCRYRAATVATAAAWSSSPASSPRTASHQMLRPTANP